MIFFAKPNRIFFWLLLIINCNISMVHAENTSAGKNTFYVVEGNLPGEHIENIPVWLVPTLTFGIAFVLISGLLIHNNVLKRRLSQQTVKLREQEKQVILLASNMSDWVWTLDTNQHFSYVSPSVKKLLGYRADELL
ncbi:MAG: PAS domain S-box protein, partial [Moraxellaceae bacterium]